MFLKKIRQAVFRIYRSQKIKEHTLNYLFWECTLKCNLNCLHCGSDCFKTSSVPDMPLNDFILVLEKIKNSGIKKLFVCITGGEPLLRKDLEIVGREIIKRGYNWGIVTNGLALTKERFSSLVNAGMASISFDLDGLKNEHDYLRQNSFAFERSVFGIELASAFKKHNPWFTFDVITCVHPGNLLSLPELRDFLISKGVQFWRIFSIFPSGRANDNKLALSLSQYRRLMDFIAETRKYKNNDGRSIHLNYSCEGFLGEYELKVRDYFFFCQAGITIASVMCNGDIGACLSVRAKDFIHGNIYRDDFIDVWNNRFENMRNRAWAKIGACKKCRQWKNCMGNSLHLHKDAHSEPAFCNYHILKGVDDSGKTK